MLTGWGKVDLVREYWSLLSQLKEKEPREGRLAAPGSTAHS